MIHVEHDMKMKLTKLFHFFKIYYLKKFQDDWIKFLIVLIFFHFRVRIKGASSRDFFPFLFLIKLAFFKPRFLDRAFILTRLINVKAKQRIYILKQSMNSGCIYYFTFILCFCLCLNLIQHIISTV